MLNLKPKEVLEYVLNALLFGGLTAIAIGFSSWAIRLLHEYEVSWEIEIAFIGILLMIFAGIAAKLLSRIN